MNEREFLLSFAEAVSSHKTGKENLTWRAREGIRILIDPSARCPHCQQMIQTNRIWMIDEAGKEVINIWDIKTSLPIAKPHQGHPHISHPRGGRVCLGNSKTLVEALFLGIAPGSHYYNTEIWFNKYIGHKCPNLRHFRCPICQDTAPESSALNFTTLLRDSSRVCSNECLDHAKITRCNQCFDVREFHEPNWKRMRGRCQKCFEMSSTQCDRCHEHEITPYTSRVRSRYSIASKVWCSPCTTYHARECRGCNYLIPTDYLVRGYCSDCNPYPNPTE